MIRKSKRKNHVEVLQGTLDMLILQTLQWGPQHGYDIVQALRTKSGEVLQVETGSLYPALHRLERQGLGTFRMEANGEQATCPLLPHHGGRQEPVGYRPKRVGQDRAGYWFSHGLQAGGR